MANFPGALPTAGNAVSSDTLAVSNHTSRHNVNDDETRAIAAKVGTGASTPTNGLFLVGTGIGTSGWRAATKADVGLSNVDNVSVQTVIGTIYPVGAIYISTVSTNPGTLFGFGTWVAFAVGRTLFGFDAGQTEFDVVEETGGEKTHVLTLNEAPAHTHSVTVVAPRTTNAGVDTTGTGIPPHNGVASGNSWTSSSGSADSQGGNAAHNNLPPYVVTYMFKRSA